MLGRQREREVLGRLLNAARAGDGGALVVNGEPGVGKTALLEWTADEGQQLRVLRTIGVEGEMELPFAALQQLCSPILDRSQRLPAPQRDALSVAFGLSAGQSPNPFLVGLAALGLLSEASQEQPLLAIIDDAQWLDRASARALAFVARRLLAEKIAFVLAAREVGDAFAGLPELRVEPLGRRDSRTLLESVLPARLDDRVLDRIVVETRGNPLALLEMPSGRRQHSSRVGSGSRWPCRYPRASRRASRGGWPLFQVTRDACCSWRRPIQLATRRSCGGRREDSASPSRLWKPSKRKTCSSLAPEWCSVIRWFVRLSTGQLG